MFDEAWVEVSGGNLVRLPELSARLAVGEKGPVSDRPYQVYNRIIMRSLGYIATAHVHRSGNLWIPTRQYTTEQLRHSRLCEAHCSCHRLACN